MNMSLHFAPYLPPWLLAVTAAALVAVVVFAWLRGQRSALWRLIAGAMLLLVIANPVLQRELRETLPDIVVAVVDDSTSQTIGQRRQDSEKALGDLQAQIKNMPQTELRIVRAASEVTPDSKGTSLFAPLAQSLADLPADRLAGIFMITDGAVHDVPEKDAALPFKAPLHALITGNDKERDRRVTLIDAPRFAVLNTAAHFRFQIDDSAQLGEMAQITISLNGAVMSSESVKVGTPLERTVEITTPGENVVEISVAKADGELTQLNNRAAIAIKAVRENLRVLLVSGEPHTGERTWRNLLKSDPAVDLVHFTILRPPDKVDATPVRELSLIAFPVRELFQDKIADFDLIIFDRYERRNILPMIYFSNMADYVRGGGAILVVSGPEDSGIDSVYQTSLADVLPVTPTGVTVQKPFVPNLTELGERHPVTRGLPGWNRDKPQWSHWFRAIDVDLHPNAQAVMTGPDKKPLVVLGEVEKGRVATLLSDQIWLWARGFEGGGPHTDLLRRIVHWLMKEPELEQEALRAHQNGASLVIERQSMEQAGTAVQVQRPDGAIETRRLRQDKPGLWQTNVDAKLPGLYRVSQGARSTLVAVGPPNPLEFADMRSTTQNLSAFAAATGGDVMRLNDGNPFHVPRLRFVQDGDIAHGNGWSGIVQRHVSDLKGIETYPLLQGFAAFLLTLGFIALAWYREGR